MNVLSLFDGCSGGQVALQKADIHVDNYFASEIDKYAMKVTQANFPDTIQLGDVSEFSEDYLKAHNHFDDPPIDLLMGGSPCQGFSFAGHQLQFADPRSKLFYGALLGGDGSTDSEASQWIQSGLQVRQTKSIP